MSNLGNGIIGFFGGESSGGGGTSTGVNGLNGTTNIGLGGTLTGNTTINGSFTETLYFGQLGNCTIETYGTANLNSNGLNFTSVLIISTSQDGISLSSYLTSDNTQRTYFLQSYNQIYTKKNNTNLGLNLDFTNREFTLGDYADAFTKTKLVVDDVNGRVFTEFFTSNCGIFLTEGNATFTANDGTDNIGLNINGTTKEFNAIYGGNIVNGLSLNFDTFVYKFGGFDIASNGTLLQINDSTFTTSLNTDILELSGAIIDNNAPLNVGVKYLVVTLSGVEYSILCTETNL